MKTKQKNPGFKINLMIVLVYGILMIVLFANQFFQKQELLNLTIVISVAFILFILYRIWFYTGIFLRNKDKSALSFLVSFFIEMGQEKDFENYISRYFLGYNKKQIQRIVRKYLESNKSIFIFGKKLRFNSIFYRKYLGYIMLSYNFSNISKYQKEVLKKYINILFPSSNMLQQIDYYLFSHSKSRNNKRKQLETWELYESIGLFPETAFWIINKRTRNRKDMKRVFKNLLDSNDKGQRKRRQSFFFKNILAFTIFSIVFIFTNDPYFYFGHPLFLISIELLKLRIGLNEQQPFNKDINISYKFTGLKRLLLTELTVHFLYDRYNVDETNIQKYLKSFVKPPYIHEVTEIVKEQKSLKDICFQIYNSGYESSDFIKHLFEVAAADKIFSDGEDTYIKRVAKYLEIEKEDIKIIRDRFLARGVKEQKAEYRKYKNTSSFSSSVYKFYSSKAYKILGINKTATTDEIKKAYRTLVKKHHPDKFATQGEEAMEKAEENFQIITEAYELIKRLRGIK